MAKPSKKGTNSIKTSKAKLDKVDKEYTGIRLDRLPVYMISTGQLVAVHITDENRSIQLTKSWAEFIVVLLHMVYKLNPNSFMKILVTNKVINASLVVSKNSIQSEDSKVYTIPQTSYNLIIKNDGGNILSSIKGLLKALDLKGDKIELDILPLDNTLNMVSVTDKLEKESLLSIDKIVNPRSITIMSRRMQCISIETMLACLLGWINEAYSNQFLLRVTKYNNEFIRVGAEPNVVKLPLGGITKIPGTVWYLSISDKLNTKQYILNICNEFNLSPTLIEIEQLIHRKR